MWNVCFDMDHVSEKMLLDKGLKFPTAGNKITTINVLFLQRSSIPVTETSSLIPTIHDH
jgi:hypothetical protein